MRISTIIVSLVFLLASPLNTAWADAGARTSMQSDQQYLLVEMVNGLRAQYGLPPYQINAALMTAAQLHSEWAASVGYHSHVGPDGSRPRDRAARAGYGGGREIWVSENIYWGGMASPESALAWWSNSSIHFQGMTSTRYQEIGAGVAYSDTGGYFTLLFGLDTGNPGSSPAEEAPVGQPANAQPAAPAEPGLVPSGLIPLSTPGPDGSVVHTVGDNEVPIRIAEAYGVDLNAMLRLNGLSESSVIYPGDQLIIKEPSPYTPTPPATLTPTPGPTGTPGPRGTGTPGTLVADLGAQEPISAKPTPSDLEITFGRRLPRVPIAVVSGVVALIGAMLVTAGLIGARRKPA